jgi:glycine betaine/proline transport system substrate-binding protein
MQFKAPLPTHLFLLLVIFLTHPVRLAYANSTEQNKPLVIALNDWASQRVLSRVTGHLFERLNIPYSYQQIEVADQWGAFRMGLVDVQVELWQGTNTDLYYKNINKGIIVDVGDHAVNAREEWWYPSYVKPLCPGLPDWRALLNCEKLFANPQSNGKGIYYSGQWNKSEGTRIRALGLNFSIQRLVDDTALWKELHSAVKIKKPIILLNWEPNWTSSRISGEFVEFPPYHPKCITKARWGLNKQLTNDCANPKAGWIKKVSSVRLKNQFSCAFKTLRRATFTTEMIAEAAALVINDNRTEAQASKIWIEIYKPQWLSWIPSECDPRPRAASSLSS